MRRIDNNSGFTIIELMIATLVFSVVLLVMTIGIMSVGRSFYKGVVSTKTQEAVRVITDEVMQAVQFSPNDVRKLGSNGYCIGETLYSYTLGQQPVNGTKTFVASKVNDCASVTSGLSVAQMNDPARNTRALLAENMRLANFSVGPASSNPELYEIKVKVVYGEDADLIEPNATTARCSNQAQSSQFCATAEVITHVQRRLQTN